MNFIATPLAGSFIVELEQFRDDRGCFARTFCQREFARIGFDGKIVQINHSLTRKPGTVRGMHYQRPPESEIKIIRCVAGAVFDVMVDLRAGSPTFLQWHGVELSAENLKMVFIPEGFAHGFQALTGGVELIYHHSAFYSPAHEGGVRHDDPALGIRWPLPATDLSARDRMFPPIDRHFKGLAL